MRSILSLILTLSLSGCVYSSRDPIPNTQPASSKHESTQQDKYYYRVDHFYLHDSEREEMLEELGRRALEELYEREDPKSKYEKMFEDMKIE